MSPDQPDEVRGDDVAAAEQQVAGLDELDDIVPPTRPDGHDQPAALPELLGQRRWDTGKRGGDQDASERLVFHQALGAITNDHVRALHALTPEVLSGRVGDVGEALDAPDLAGEARQQGSLPAVARPDLEHPFPTGKLEGLDHPGHQRRLSRHLALRDGQRPVLVGPVRDLRRHECRPRYGADGLQHSWIPDACKPARADKACLHPASMEVSHQGWSRLTLPSGRSGPPRGGRRRLLACHARLRIK